MPPHRAPPCRPCSTKTTPTPAVQVAALTQHLDVLINATGILHDASMSPETALARVTMDSLLKCFQVSSSEWSPCCCGCCIAGCCTAVAGRLSCPSSDVLLRLWCTCRAATHHAVCWLGGV